MEATEHLFLLNLNFRAGDELRMHVYYEDLEAALNQFFSFSGGQFTISSEIRPFADYPLDSVSMLRADTGQLLASSGIQRSFADVTPGYYLYFPGGLANFERFSGVGLSAFRDYRPEGQRLLMAHEVRHGFEPTIAYENISETALQWLNGNGRSRVDFERRFFDKGSELPRNIQSAKRAEVYVFKSADKALKKLLGTDFNKLDQSVAWEHEMPDWTKRAGLSAYRGLSYRYHTLEAELHSLRRGSMNVGLSKLTEPGIYLKMSEYDREKGGYSYPFDKLERLSGSKDIYVVGTYDQSRSRASKVPGLLLPFIGASRGKTEKDTSKAAALKESGKARVRRKKGL